MRYPWEAASTQHLIHRMSDDELAAAIEAACAGPRSVDWLHMTRLATEGRRALMGQKANIRATDAIVNAYRRAKEKA